MRNGCAMTEREIFTAALTKADPAARAAFLDGACAGDAALRRRVDSLLAENEQLGSFMEGPSLTHASDAPALECPGTQIGPYKLLQQIGEGGMGTVFMAEQTRPIQRKVAIKVIKAGMDSRQVIARFEAERQALAMMEHLNIAKVLDAGTTENGRPYFVMELVKGLPITEYCDAHHLSVAQRLELMIAVCQAVQHAHQKGIIHRDIKPSNVLVAEYDGQPVPKIIDFGVVKAIAQPLTEATVFTQFGQIVGTFEYMSPEQARFNQLDVDTRSDIYSLGVLMYELLAGNTPLEKERLRSAAFDEILRIISEEEPPRPSARLSSSQSLPSIAANRSLDPKQLTGLVSGELDWIVMKCLEKERDKRYGTAEQVADEFRRFLSGEPIHARAITARQRMWRWYRRNVTLVAGAFTVFTFSVIGVTHLALFAIVQFLIRRPDASEVLYGLGPTAFTIAICLLVVESGVATYRGKRRGLLTSLIVFSLFSLGECWTLYWAIEICRAISDVPIYSFQAVIPNTIDARNVFVRNCVIGYVLVGMTWALVGLGLHIHALCRPATGGIRNSKT